MKQKDKLLTEGRAREMMRGIIREEVPPIVAQIVSETATQILNVMAERFEKVDRRFDRIEANCRHHDLALDDHEVRLCYLERHTI